MRKSLKEQRAEETYWHIKVDEAMRTLTQPRSHHTWKVLAWTSALGLSLLVSKYFTERTVSKREIP